MRLPSAAAETALVYFREVRSLSRDRHTVIYSVLLPLFLYSSLLWGAFQAFAYIKGLDERRVSRVAVQDSALDGSLLRFLESHVQIHVETLSSQEQLAPGDILRSGRAQAVLLHAPEGPEALPLASRATIYFNSADDGSAKAKERLRLLLDDWRAAEIRDLSRASGFEVDSASVLKVQEENLATTEETSRFTASMVLPFMSIIMMLLGALYPALDVTVGERERGTLETTLVSPAGRGSIVMGKYLAVVTSALFAFLLNFASLSFTLAHLNSQVKGNLFTVDLSVSAVLVILLAAALLAFLLSAVVMLLAFCARTFKEGQAYMTPIFVLTIAPAGILLSPDVRWSTALALTPVLNLLLSFREALRGRDPGSYDLLAFAASLTYAVGALWAATILLRRESFVAGEGPSVQSFWSRLVSRKPRFRCP